MPIIKEKKLCASHESHPLARQTKHTYRGRRIHIHIDIERERVRQISDKRERERERERERDFTWKLQMIF
ncbi:hypothetical protein L2E82_41240 [Cichorium intybus]|uniref:Uncharacterized protein n=1 Tax=Cichorium intybus TaxID=13427 RepID=A0ACB9ANQ5_CICIN|nr:hypothetical protein L2E82_41240 [Cichorium intybus]